MNISKLLSNPKISALSGNEFKAYCILLNKSKKGIIENFTIKGITREWQENSSSLNISKSKTTIKNIIRELELLGLIKNDMKNKKLIFIN